MGNDKSGKNISKYEFNQTDANARYIREFDLGINYIFTCFKQKVEDGWSFKGEKHSSWEMVYVMDGFVYVSEDGRVSKLTKGDVIFHLSGEFHRIWCENCPTARFMVISFGADHESFKSLGDKVIKLNVEKCGELEDLYNEICATFNVNFTVQAKTDESERNLVKEKMTFLKFELFLLSLLNEERNSNASKINTSAQNYKLIIDTMTENINRNLTVEELAKLCNLSVSNLKKTFNKYGSGGVIRHFNRMRIQKAIKFLRTGNSIARVSRDMGFSSQNYFSVIFKRETGMLPSEF